MAEKIEDYGLIGDLQTAALVGLDGSVDWLCLPRFDSAACFARLLGTEEHGRWLLAPSARARRIRRWYRPGTLVLETRFETGEGEVSVIDYMPVRTEEVDLVRLVVGRRGRVPMRMELVLRFDYGRTVPWVYREGGRLRAMAGPDAVCLDTPVPTRGEHLRTVADFTVAEGEEVPFALRWHPSHMPPPPEAPLPAAAATEDWWRAWMARCSYRGAWRQAVERSLLVLKALTYAPTGGMVAAPTTSLPEWPGGVRNWDYRFCWLRDATFTLVALLGSGYVDEARAWRDWVVRAAAGLPSQLQVLYGVAGERRVPEHTLPWLPGFQRSSPVRVGNAAADQFQLDIYGEVVDALWEASRRGIAPHSLAPQVERALLEFLEERWRQPDEGIWEVRGGRRHFTHSKVMAWVAADRAARLVEAGGPSGVARRWRALRDEIHREVCREGVDQERGVFVQSYGSTELDAALLLVPLVGFLPPTDPRVVATVEAIQRELLVDGFVMRYHSGATVDGLPPGEGAFLPCSFWLADCLASMGRMAEARGLFQRLLSVRNDLGLLGEEYDPRGRRLLGNFPQALSHLALVNTALRLDALGEQLRSRNHREGQPDAERQGAGKLPEPRTERLCHQCVRDA